MTNLVKCGIIEELDATSKFITHKGGENMFFDENDIKDSPSELTKDEDEKSGFSESTTKVIAGIIAAMLVAMACLCLINI